MKKYDFLLNTISDWYQLHCHHPTLNILKAILYRGQLIMIILRVIVMEVITRRHVTVAQRTIVSTEERGTIILSFY